MEVACVADTAKHLPANTLAYNRDAAMHLTIGKSYRAGGMSVYAGSIMVLICDDSQMPNWYPMQLFEVSHSRLPGNWHFAAYGDSSHLQALWGYRELVLDDAHYDSLLERDPEALRIFLSRYQRST
ncbi:hypothetical protein Sar04_48420 [Salinispora arenicola]|uniref:Uncharacterized protein n=1 Tax=Salinispora arenicola TaxID=168697 RepID=A0A542XUA7_SALAC|nr:hypothetical protein FB564_4695 [Salinispora arenicola]GIM88106.1 hypothetical protein Sar04_48420 [Salinispora arenicola]